MPDPLPVVESVVVPDPVVAHEKVVVPVEVMDLPAYIPDPAWGDMRECPSDEIWCVVTDEPPLTYECKPFVQLGIFYSPYQVDWGDGETYQSPERPVTTYNCMHTYDVSTGRVDSKGRRFWVMKIRIINKKSEFICLNGYVYSPDMVYNMTPIKFMVVGEKVDATTNFTFEDDARHMEAIQYLGKDKHIKNFPQFPYNLSNMLKYLLVDGKLHIDNLTGLRFRCTGISDLSMVEIEGGEITSYLWGCQNMANGKADFSKMTYGNLNYLFYMCGRSVEEVILPQVQYPGTSMTTCFCDCHSLRKIKMPPSMPYVEDATQAFGSCYSLYDFEIPEDFGSLGAGLKLSMSYIAKRLDLNIPDTKIRGLQCLGVKKGCTGGLIRLRFSKESQFDYLISGAHLKLDNSPLSKEAIVEIFDQLPDFTGDTQRVINLTGSIGVEELTEAEIKIATNKNWQVIGV